jgi:hypothetical protein
MYPRPRLAPKPRFIDPRRQKGFNPAWLPTVNGKPFSAGLSRAREEQLKRDFAAAYYALNRAYAALLGIRAEPERAPRRTSRERSQLKRIESALRRRDALEDHCAPLGVIAEPSMNSGYAVDLTVTFGNMDGAGKPRTDAIELSSALVPLPLPSDASLSTILTGLSRALSDR